MEMFKFREVCNYLVTIKLFIYPISPNLNIFMSAYEWRFAQIYKIPRRQE